MNSYLKDQKSKGDVVKDSRFQEKENQNKDLSLSKMLELKHSEAKEDQQENVSFPKKIESDKEITFQADSSPINQKKSSSIRKGKLTTIIKKFGDGKEISQKNQLQSVSKSVLQNINASTFKKLSKNDPLVKSLIENSKLINSLGPHLIKLQNDYELALKECQNWNKLYTDRDFPPEPQSLAQKWENLSEKQQKNWKKYVWRRAGEVFKDFDIFLNNIEPNDIRQGSLGNCYLLSSLSSLAEREHLVRKLFHPETKSPHGLYSVWLNVNGMWSNILVDDYFPCTNEKGSPAFSRGNGNEIWVLILEKAYAKVFGSYQAIEGGNPAVALRDLTGAPYENKDEVEENEMWDYIKTNDEAGYHFIYFSFTDYFIKGFILTCYTKPTMIVEQENELGLLSGHAYAILDHQEVISSFGKEDRIIKIRNPWGLE